MNKSIILEIFIITMIIIYWIIGWEMISFSDKIISTIFFIGIITKWSIGD